MSDVARFHTKNCHDVILIANRLRAKTNENNVEVHRTSYLTTNVAPFFSRNGNFISFHDTLPLGRKSDLSFRQMVRESYDVDRQCIF